MEEELNFDESMTQVFTNLSEAEDFIFYFEEASQTKFILYNKSKDFGTNVKPEGLTKNINWESPSSNRRVPIIFDGSPFLYYGHKVLECHLGRDKDRLSRERNRNNVHNNVESGHITKKSRKRKLETKKVGCQAKIYITQILRFVNIKVADKERRTKEQGIQILEENLEECMEAAEMQFYVKTPAPEAHTCLNIENVGMRESIDQRVIDHVLNLAREGYHKVSDIQAHVEYFVENVIFLDKVPPDKSRRRYYPKRKDYFNLIYKAKAEMRQIKMENPEYLDFVEMHQHENMEFDMNDLYKDGIGREEVVEEHIKEEFMQDRGIPDHIDNRIQILLEMSEDNCPVPTVDRNAKSQGTGDEIGGNHTSTTRPKLIQIPNLILRRPVKVVAGSSRIIKISDSNQLIKINKPISFGKHLVTSNETIKPS